MLDRQKLIEELELHTIGRSRKSGDKYVVTLERRFVNSIIDLLQSQPQIVRCKDCKHKEESVSPSWEGWCNRLHCDCDNDWFCADAERKEGDSG